MKASSLVIPSLLFFFSNDVLAQKIIKAKKVTNHNGLVCYVKKLIPVTGRVAVKYENIKQIKSEIDYIDGKKDGLSKLWSKNGQLIGECIYKDGKKDGLLKLWYETEPIVECIDCNYNQLSRAKKHWPEKGPLRVESIYKDGELEGLFKQWYKNGQIANEGYYKGGRKDGLHRTWNIRGIQTSEINYLDNKKDGLCKRWEYLYSKWKLTENRNYKNGIPIEVESHEILLKNGLYYRYDRDNAINGLLFSGVLREFCKGYNVGAVKYICKAKTYKDGKLDGLSREYFENGQLKSEINYKNSELDGLSKKWFENGQLKSEINYKNGELDGLSKEYFENGKVMSKKNYKAGALDGLYQKWYENGQIWKEQYYSGNMPDSIKFYSQFRYQYERNTAEIGELDSSKCWYKNGQIWKEGYYKEFKKDGSQKEWYENGQMSSQLNYKDDELDGLCKEWYENGQMSSQLNYKDGELEGLYKTWYKNGQICIEANFLGPAGSTAMSSYKTFWPNGNARSKFVYKKPFNLNNPDSWDSGTFTQYYSNGAKLRETDEFYLTTDNTDLYEFYSEFQIHMKNGATKMIDY